MTSTSTYVRLDWLADVLRDAGCKVVELDGWLDRTAHYSSGAPHRLNAVHGVVWHHTATGTNWTLGAVLAMLRGGRSDLSGPLAQLGLDRDGTFYVISGQRANHNGYGEWGNDAIGIEALNNGTGEPWPPEQYAAYVLGTAAILDHLAYGANQMKGHRETDPRRKPDPVGIDLAAARLDIAMTISQLGKGEDDMFTEEDADRQERIESKLDRLIASDRTNTARVLEVVRAVRKILKHFGLAKK